MLTRFLDTIKSARYINGPQVKTFAKNLENLPELDRFPVLTEHALNCPNVNLCLDEVICLRLLMCQQLKSLLF